MEEAICVLHEEKLNILALGVDLHIFYQSHRFSFQKLCQRTRFAFGGDFDAGCMFGPPSDNLLFDRDRNSQKAQGI